MPKTSKMAGSSCFHFCNSTCDPREKTPVSKNAPHLHPEIILFIGKGSLHPNLIIRCTKMLLTFSIYPLLFPSDCPTLIKRCSVFVNQSYSSFFSYTKQAQKHSASAQDKVAVISKTVAKVMLSSLLTNYPQNNWMLPWFDWCQRGGGTTRATALRMPRLGLEDPCSCLSSLLLAKGQTQALERKRLSHKTANPAQFSTVCASSCQLLVLLLDLPCWMCSGCLTLPNTAKGAAFHTVLSWDCPRTDPGVTSHCLQFSLTLSRCFLRLRLGSGRICKILPG